ncbi:hypothetical protein GJAV_G00114560 [Gymnothorax javanicus]|nr:hypothetical protein GJAV_G00114560 [Gymnothorax javanicus]
MEYSHQAGYPDGQQPDPLRRPPPNSANRVVDHWSRRTGTLDSTPASKQLLFTMDELSPLTFICVGSSFLFSRLFYNLYREKKRELQMIQEMPNYRPNEDLLRILKSSPQKKLPYAAVEGFVQPDGDPLPSKYIPRCFGVVQKVRVAETWEVYNSTSKTWSRGKLNSSTTNDTVPFSLVWPSSFSSKVAVQIQSPQEAAGPYLETVYHKIKYAREGLLDIIIQELAGERPFSLEETEEILRVGAALTGFGEVVLEQGRVLKLRPPSNGQKYFFFPTDFKGYLQMHQNTVTMWKVLMAIFATAGISLLAWNLYRAYQRYQSRRGGN